MGLAFGAAIMLGVGAALLDGMADMLALVACLALLSWTLPERAGRLAAIGLLGLAAGFGLTIIRNSDQPKQLEPFSEQPITGKVTSDPRLSSGGSTAVVAWTTPTRERIESRLFYSGIEDVGRGDTVAVVGEWSDAVGTVLFADRVSIVERAGRIERLRRTLRRTARDRILQRVPGSNGSLTLGLVIGDDSGLTEAERDDLRSSGLSHITAVSGSNVALVIGAIVFLLRALNRTSWIWVGAQVLAIIFYVWIVGFDPPIVRAAIMGSLALMAGLLGRPTHLFTLLALTGAVMCLLDPEALLSLGFQLSFLSMIGLGLAGDLIQRVRGQRRKVVTALLSPAGAALMTAPLLAARFGTFSPGTIPANVAVAPLIEPATIFGGLIAFIPDGFATGDLIGLVVWLMTGSVLWISRYFGGSSYAVVTFSPLSSTQTVGIYFALAFAASPLIPEARLTAHQVRRWAEANPARSVITALAGSAMLAAVALLLD